MGDLKEQEGNTFAAVLQSALPCARLDSSGILRDPSPGLLRLLPSVSDVAVDLALGVSFDQLREHLGKQVAGQFEHQDGSLRPICLFAVPMSPPAADSFFLMISDMEPMRGAEEARFEATPYPIMRLNPSGQITFANKQACIAFGQDIEALRSKKLASLFASDKEHFKNVEAGIRDAVADAVPQSLPMPAPPDFCHPSNPKDIVLHLMPDFGPEERVLGSVAVISWGRLDGVTSRIVELMASKDSWDKRLRSILEELRAALPHDRAVFTVAAQGASPRLYPRIVHPVPKDTWPRRWIEVPDPIVRQMAAGPFVIPDLVKFVELFPRLKDDPLIQRNIADGIRSVLVLPVADAEGISAVLLLCAFKPDQFGIDSVAIAGALLLDARLGSLLHAAQQADDDVVSKIGDDIVEASSLDEAAMVLLRGLVEHFHWDHAAIFVADPTTKRFRLFQQHPLAGPDGSANDLALPDGYSQPLDDSRASGMLGSAYRAKEALLVTDSSKLDADGYPEHNFITAGTEETPARSSMTVPIRLDGEIRWMLDIISTHTDAFAEPDKKAVTRTAERLEHHLMLLRERLISDELLEASEQGIILTGRTDRIIRANRRARDLLSLPPRMTGASESAFGEYIRDSEARKFLGLPHFSREPMRIGPPMGSGHAVLVTRRALESYDGESIWVLTDQRDEEWEHDARIIENVIHEVAGRTRGPLMIAKSILRRIADAPEEHKLADRATKALERVDITFQDVADAVSVSKVPRRRQDRLRITDIARSIVDGLSKQEKQCVRLRCPATPIEVMGDASRIELVLQTLVRAGLTRANVSEPLEFALRRQNSMAIADCRVGRNRGARKLSPLGLDDWKVPTKVVEAHGGTIVAEGVASLAEPLHVVVRLPLAPEADHA